MNKLHVIFCCVFILIFSCKKEDSINLDSKSHELGFMFRSGNINFGDLGIKNKGGILYFDCLYDFEEAQRRIENFIDYNLNTDSTVEQDLAYKYFEEEYDFYSLRSEVDTMQKIWEEVNQDYIYADFNSSPEVVCPIFDESLRVLLSPERTCFISGVFVKFLSDGMTVEAYNPSAAQIDSIITLNNTEELDKMARNVYLKACKPVVYSEVTAVQRRGSNQFTLVPPVALGCDYEWSANGWSSTENTPTVTIPKGNILQGDVTYTVDGTSYTYSFKVLNPVSCMVGQPFSYETVSCSSIKLKWGVPLIDADNFGLTAGVLNFGDGFSHYLGIDEINNLTEQTHTFSQNPSSNVTLSFILSPLNSNGGVQTQILDLTQALNVLNAVGGDSGMVDDLCVLSYVFNEKEDNYGMALPGSGNNCCVIADENSWFAGPTRYKESQMHDRNKYILVGAKMYAKTNGKTKHVMKIRSFRINKNNNHRRQKRWLYPSLQGMHSYGQVLSQVASPTGTSVDPCAGMLLIDNVQGKRSLSKKRVLRSAEKFDITAVSMAAQENFRAGREMLDYIGVDYGMYDPGVKTDPLDCGSTLNDGRKVCVLRTGPKEKL